MESPRAVHRDAIHETDLMYGVKVVIQKPVEESWEVLEPDNEARYHITTICRQIADEFFQHKGERGYIPKDHHRRHVLRLEVDREFHTYAKSEFASKGIQEEKPVFADSPHAVVNTLTTRLVEAFEENALKEGSGGLGSLTLERMFAVRDDVFERAKQADQGPAPDRVDHFYEPLPRHSSCECGPVAVLGASVVALCLMLLGALWEPPKKEREQKVSHFSPHKDFSKMRGEIY